MHRAIPRQAAKKMRSAKNRKGEWTVRPDGTTTVIVSSNLPERLTIKSPGETYRTVRLAFGLTQPKMALLTGFSPRKLSALETEERSASREDAKRFTELVRLRKELAHVVAPEAISDWLQEPNDYFNGLSPMQVIERGESDRLWRLIWRLQDGVPLD